MPYRHHANTGVRPTLCPSKQTEITPHQREAPRTISLCLSDETSFSRYDLVPLHFRQTTVVRNNEESKHKQWATRSFARIAHSLTPEFVRNCMIRCLKTTWFCPTVQTPKTCVRVCVSAAVAGSSFGRDNGEKSGVGRGVGFGCQHRLSALASVAAFANCLGVYAGLHRL